MYIWTSDQPNRTIDGDFDAGVIGHEYGHGVSTRMVGGPSTNCLSSPEQGGEGWSDFEGLMITLMDVNNDGVYSEDVDGEGIRGIGNYVLNQGAYDEGIRNAPYSTNMDINDYTYGDVPDVSAPHGVGHIWCTILWDLTWRMIDKYGFDFDIYNSEGSAGNIRTMAIVHEAFRYTACSPSFIDMRDAVFAANQALYPDDANGDELMFWEVFARRGLGFSATEGANEAFDLPTFHTVKSVNYSEQGKGKEIDYTIRVDNNFTTDLTNVVITDELDPRLEFVSSSDGATANGQTVTFPAFSIPVDQSTVKTFTVKIRETADHTTSFGVNEMETPTEQAAFTPLGQWATTSNSPHSGETAFFHPDMDAPQAGDLQMVTTIPAGATAIAFWQKLDTEVGFDGGVFEISTDGGLNFEDLGRKMIVGGYNSIISSNAFGAPFTVLDGRRAFSGTKDYFQTVVDISDYSGAVTFRWRYASDIQVGQVGWWIDDVEFLDFYHVTNEACVTTNEFAELTLCGDVGELGTIIRDNSFTALPIELLELTAQAEKNNIRLNWTTIDEIDHDGFELLRRSADEEEFTSITFIKGKGSINTTTNYSYLDKNVRPNMRYYYQLKSIDNSNRADFSNIVSAIVTEDETIVQVYPNPATDQVTVNVIGQEWKDAVEIDVLDTRGQLVRNYLFEENSLNRFTLDFSDLPEQMYMVRVKSGDFVNTQQVTVQR